MAIKIIDKTLLNPSSLQKVGFGGVGPPTGESCLRFFQRAASLSLRRVS